MPKVEADRQLLFGLLALQTGLISQGALFSAFNDWTRAKDCSMADILVAQGGLDASHRGLLERLVAEHLKMHGGDAHRSLAAIHAGRSTRERLAQVSDPDLAASIAHVGPMADPAAMPPPELGGPALDSAATVRQRLLAEQREGWDRGECPRVEAYLERDPKLRDHPESLLELIYQEVLLRERNGERPVPEEYARRFPELREAIFNQFEVHLVFADRSTAGDSGNSQRTSSFSAGTSAARGQRFRVLRPHRSGGLGAVFVALDAELNREVALKQILDRHADDPVSRSRFVIEAEITGGLEHPGIVPVYGLGTYGQGRPFYAMRFVRGDSLKDAIVEFHGDPSLRRDPGRRSLELRNLLRRFVDVCNAIEYAHSRGVLHRDIKPANIIVGKHGETLVVDWGLAKAIGRAEPAADSEERTLVPSSTSGSAETLPGSALGTPAFMSPEQARGDLARLGPRSDVYSLGATLYVLLTGRLPFEGNDVGKVLQAVWLGEFQPPRQLQPSIDRALEAVCMKAMARNLEDRYDSPRALADDVERWTADEPVTVWQPPLADRARRWARRHRTFVSSSAAILILGLIGLSAFAALVGDKNRRLVAATIATRQAEALADARLDRAMTSIKDYFTGFSALALKGGQLPPALRDRLLAKPREFYERLAVELAAKPDPTERERALLATGQASLGRILRILGKDDQARAIDEAAVASFEALVARYPDNGDYRDGLANSYNTLGFLLAKTSQSDEAVIAYRKAIAVHEALTTQANSKPEYQHGLALSHTNLATLNTARGRLDEAAAEYQKVIAIYQSLTARFPEVGEYQKGLAWGHANLGNIRATKGRLDEARAEYKATVAISEALVGHDPGEFEYQDLLGKTLSNLGVILNRAGRFDEAVGSYRQAIRIREELAGRQPDVPDYRSDLASSHLNLGAAFGLARRFDDASAEFKHAVTIFEELTARYPGVPSYENGLAMSRNNLGEALQDTGHLAEAFAALKQAVTNYETLVARHPEVPSYRDVLAMSHASSGKVLAALRRRDEAIVAYKKAVAIREDLAGHNPDVPAYQSGLAEVNMNLGTVFSDAGRPDEAASAFTKAVAINEALLARYPKVPSYRNALAMSQLNLGMFRKRRGKLSDAMTAFRRGAQVASPRTRTAAELAEHILQTETALAVANRLPAILNGNDEPRSSAEAAALAQLCYDKGRYRSAARLWGSALATDPKLAVEQRSQLRYNAACAAALAAAGKGKHEPPPDDATRARLRAQARDWLRAELAHWTNVVATGPASVRAGVTLTLQHWQQDADLTILRDPDALARLPERERKDCDDIWAQVGALLTRARGERP